MWRVSSLLSTPVRRLVPFESAASSRARLVIDFEPGGATRPRRPRCGGTIVSASVTSLIRTP